MDRFACVGCQDRVVFIREPPGARSQDAAENGEQEANRKAQKRKSCRRMKVIHSLLYLQHIPFNAALWTSLIVQGQICRALYSTRLPLSCRQAGPSRTQVVLPIKSYHIEMSCQAANH